MKSRLVSVSLVVVIVALIALIAMLAVRRGEEVSAPPPVQLSDEDREEVEHVIRARINTLSPVPAMLGGRFDVSTIEWDARGRATVTYGDGESTFEGVATVLTGSGRARVGAFEVER